MKLINAIRDELDEVNSDLMHELLETHEPPQAMLPGDVSGEMFAEHSGLGVRRANQILYDKFLRGEVDRFLTVQHGKRMFAYRKKVV